MENKRYPAKLLLFGEYAIVKGEKGLAVPFFVYGGRWQQSNGEKPLTTPSLQPLVNYIADLQQQGELLVPFDVERLQADVNQGLYFESNIPQGYGLGSSGALVAALFDRYARTQTTDFSTLKAVFSQLESYFHGRSSGLDPLVSYLQQAVCIAADDIFTLALPPLTAVQLWLVDSLQPRQTAPLVRYFLEQCERETFMQRFKNELCAANEKCIEAVQNKDEETLWDNWKILSTFQYEHFSPMIPVSLREHWEQGLETEDYLLKICGAGGGGFLLGITKAEINLADYFPQHPILAVRW